MIKIAVVNSDLPNPADKIYKLSKETELEFTLKEFPGEATPDTVNDDESLVIVLNVKLCGEHGLELINQVKHYNAKICVMLTCDNDCHHLNNSVLTNAAKIVINNKQNNSLVEELNYVINDGKTLSPRVTKKILKYLAEPLPDTYGRSIVMTRREIELMRLVVNGMSNKEISQKMKISYNTVKNHLKKIFIKLNASSRFEAISNFQKAKH